MDKKVSMRMEEAGVLFYKTPGSLISTGHALLSSGLSQASPPRAELIFSSNSRQLLQSPTNCLGLTLFYSGGLHDGLVKAILGKQPRQFQDLLSQ